MKKKLTALIVLLFIMTSVVSYAFGALRQVTANVNDTLVLKVDGETVQILDSSGKPAAPLVYNNTTYLPLRFVASLFNKPLSVSENTILLGELNPDDTKSITPTGTGFVLSKAHTSGETFSNEDFTSSVAAYFENMNIYNKDQDCIINTENARELSFNISAGPNISGSPLIIQMFDDKGVLIDFYRWYRDEYWKFSDRRTYDVTGTKYVKFKVSKDGSPAGAMILADPIIVVPK